MIATIQKCVRIEFRRSKRHDLHEERDSRDDSTGMVRVVKLLLFRVHYCCVDYDPPSREELRKTMEVINGVRSMNNFTISYNCCCGDSAVITSYL